MTHRLLSLVRPRSAWFILAVLGCLISLHTPSAAAALGIPCTPFSDMSANDQNCHEGFQGDFRNPNPDGYLSIAMSSTMAVGAAWGPNQQDASNQALADCNRRSPTPCRIAWSQLNTCASVAGSAGDKIVAIGALKGPGWNASGLAMSNCARAGGRQCQVLVTACAQGYVSPRVWAPPRPGAPAYQAPVLRLPRGS